MLQTRNCTLCGQEFTEEGFHLICPKDRKMIEREKKRITSDARNLAALTGEQCELKWWLPQ